MPNMRRTKFGLSQSEDARLHTLASALLSRTALMSKLGKSFGGDRDLYTALGYPVTLTFQHYIARYSRQDIAKRIVDAPVVASWRKKPTVSDDEEDTDFEKTWSALEEKRKLYHYLSRVDKLSGIGRYAVLLIGFDDAENEEALRGPVTAARDINFIRPYTEQHAVIKTWNTDITSPEYGTPDTYELTTSTVERTGQRNLIVHASRLLHITEGMQEDDIFGVPRLKHIYNRLQDLELVSGSSAEMHWRGAFPGYAFNIDKDATIGTQDLDKLKDELEEYMHGLKRYIRTRGMTVESLNQQVADPKGTVDVLVQLIAGAVDIPTRILLGSERGELASSQDETAWNNNIESRRENFVSPWVLRPLIDRCIKVGVLPSPVGDTYDINWPSIYEPSEKDQAEVTKIKTEALSKYASSPGTELVIPVHVFRTKFLGMSNEESEAIDELVEEQMEEERKQMEEESIILEEDPIEGIKEEE